MKELFIDSNWNFKETVKKIKTIRDDYKEILTSFSYFETKKKVEFKKKIRDNIYSLKLYEWEKDKIWNYMNGFEFLYTLEQIAQKRK